MAKITVELSDEKDEDLLKLLATEQRNLYIELNEIRWTDFRNREKIFEKTIEDVPDTPLPRSTEMILLKANAQDWSEHILQAVKTGNISRLKSSDIISTDNLWFDKTKIASPINSFPSLCINSSEVRKEDGMFRIQTDEGVLTLDVTDGESAFSEIEDTPLYLYETNTGYALEPYDIFSYQPPLTVRSDDDSQQESRAVLRTLSVAASVTPVAQVEPPTDTPGFPEIFEEVGLYWEEIDTDGDSFTTYLVGTRKRGKKRITEFLEVDYTHRTMEDYCKLLGFPNSVGEYYCDAEWLEKDFDRYSCEEFAIYGVLRNEIEESEAEMLFHAPYRPPPTIQEVQYAIQLAKQFKEGLNILYNESSSEGDYEQIADYYEDHSAYNTSLSDKPILEVKEWLADCQIRKQQNPVNE